METQDKYELQIPSWMIWALIILGLILGSIMIFGAGDKEIYPKEVICKNNSCIEESIDNFNKCVELGKENIGFLRYEKYYLCDGIKIVNTCLEKNNSYYISDNNYTGNYLISRNCQTREINNTQLLPTKESITKA